MPQIKKLRTEDEWRSAYPALNALRSRISEAEFLSRREELIEQGYHLFGLEEDGAIVAVASADIYPHVTEGKNCWVHDLATLSEKRSQGYGKRLMKEIEVWAKAEGCSRLCVHTRLNRDQAQRFYEEKLGYAKTAVVYYHDL